MKIEDYLRIAVQRQKEIQAIVLTAQTLLPQNPNVLAQRQQFVASFFTDHGFTPDTGFSVEQERTAYYAGAQSMLGVVASMLAEVAMKDWPENERPGMNKVGCYFTMMVDVANEALEAKLQGAPGMLSPKEIIEGLREAAKAKAEDEWPTSL